MSMALRQQIPILELLKEVVTRGVDVQFKPPTSHCKALKDNSGALEMA